MIDLYENHPYGGVDSRGQPCNMHSWSSKGAWSPVCYTADHFYAQGMWDKPREITLNMYQGNGYENAYGGAGDDPNIAANAMRAWRSDPGHADVIVERGIWKNMRWPAMGVGIYHGFAVLWFGNSADPQGALDQCQ